MHSSASIPKQHHVRRRLQPLRIHAVPAHVPAVNDRPVQALTRRRTPSARLMRTSSRSSVVWITKQAAQAATRLTGPLMRAQPAQSCPAHMGYTLLRGLICLYMCSSKRCSGSGPRELHLFV